MTWRDAIHNHAFVVFAIIIASMLAASALVLAILTFVLKRDVAKLWTIWRSWCVMASLGLAAVFAGRFATIAGTVLVAVFAFKEFARATGLYHDWGLAGASYLAIIAVGLCAALPDFDAAGTRPGCFDLLLALPACAAALLLLIPIARNRFEGQLQAVSLAILGFLLVGWMFGHIAFLTNMPDPYGPLIYLVFAVEISDISAYSFGRLLGHPGRHPLRSRISPNKTWEGALGALGVSMALPWIMAFALPPAFDAIHKILLGLIVGIGGPLGDLAISLIKRDLNLKDMGAAIPGHGGILDRIDSLIFTAPLFFRLIHWVEPLR